MNSERRKTRRRVLKQFVPLEGSLKHLFHDKKPQGQAWRYYLRDLFKEIRFTFRCTKDRIWYGQAGSSYYDLDHNLILTLRNGIAMLAEMSTGYSPQEFESYEAWIRELHHMRNNIDEYLKQEDLHNEEAGMLEISKWLSKYLPHLWD